MSRFKTLDFRRDTFGLLKDLPGGIPWGRDLEGKDVQESWLMLKHHFLQAQDWCIPMNKKSHKAQQETFMDEQRASGKTQKEEESLQNAGKGMGCLQGKQKRYQSMQRCDGELSDPLGTGKKNVKDNKKGILPHFL